MSTATAFRLRFCSSANFRTRAADLVKTCLVDSSKELKAASIASRSITNGSPGLMSPNFWAMRSKAFSPSASTSLRMARAPSRAWSLTAQRRGLASVALQRLSLTGVELADLVAGATGGSRRRRAEAAWPWRPSSSARDTTSFTMVSPERAPESIQVRTLRKVSTDSPPVDLAVPPVGSVWLGPAA